MNQQTIDAQAETIRTLSASKGTLQARVDQLQRDLAASTGAAGQHALEVARLQTQVQQGADQCGRLEKQIEEQKKVREDEQAKEDEERRRCTAEVDLAAFSRGVNCHQLVHAQELAEKASALQDTEQQLATAKWEASDQARQDATAVEKLNSQISALQGRLDIEIQARADDVQARDDKLQVAERHASVQTEQLAASAFLHAQLALRSQDLHGVETAAGRRGAAEGASRPMHCGGG